MIWPPTPRQLDLLRFIAGYQAHHGGASPAYDECAAALGVNKTGIQRLITGLDQRGHICRRHRAKRAIQLVTIPAVPRAPEGAPLFFIPVLNGASA